MKKAIIIGAISGIGKRLAKILTDNNYKVGITGRRTELLAELKLPNKTAYYPRAFDIADTRIIVENLETFTTEPGELDLLIINSGTGGFYLHCRLHFQLFYKTEIRTFNDNKFRWRTSWK